MPSYAILGATGTIGSKILSLLLQDPSNELHLYVRSKSKLLTAEPAISSHLNTTIYEGDLQDTTVIKSCISGVTTIFLTVALSENLPGCSIAIDTAKVVVEALHQLCSQSLTSSSTSKFKTPKLVILSSASVSDKYSQSVPAFIHRVLFLANYHIYIDLQAQEKFLRQQSDWLVSTFVKPGGLSEDVARGYRLDPENSHTFMSYSDLAMAMIEVAERGREGETWDLREVGIVPATEGQGATMELKTLYVLCKGLVAGLFPGVYLRLRGWLP